MTAPELKPCPFCGEEQPPHDDTSWVRCLGCGAETGWQPTGADAITAWNRRADLAAVQPAPEALHRSFPDAGDGRPMPPMGDELMIAGLSVDDARFVAVQLAQNGLTLTAQPDPRDEVIARLVEALEGYKSRSRRIPFDLAVSSDAALAAAKAVQHG